MTRVKVIKIYNNEETFEIEINKVLRNIDTLIDIKYSVIQDRDSDICLTAIVIYENEREL